MKKRFQTRLIILIVILLAALGANEYLLKAPPKKFQRKSLAEFPQNIGPWKAVGEFTIDTRTMKILQVDDYLIRTYVDSEGNGINLYIGYFESQKEGKGIHSPRQCLPGAGWTPTLVETKEIPLGSQNSSKGTVNKYVMGKGLERQLYLFWYQGRGRVYASEYLNKLYLVWDGVLRRRTDGALVRINNPVKGDVEEAFVHQVEFITQIAPLLDKFIPH